MFGLINVKFHLTNRLLGLVFLKTLRYGIGVEDSVIDSNGLNVEFKLSDEYGQRASPMYRRLAELCLKESVTAFTVETFTRSICAFKFIPIGNNNQRLKSVFVKIGPMEVILEYPRFACT